MKKVITLLFSAMMCLSLSAHAPVHVEQDSHISQRYENQMFTQRQKFVADRLTPITSDRVFKYIMASPFVTDIEVNKKLFEIAQSLNVDPVDLITVIWAESTLSTTAVNDSSNAAGLIQFMPSTLKGMGLTKEELLNMSILEQLDEVERYFNLTGKVELIEGFMDLYLAVFYPKAVGKGENYVICRIGGKTYRQNFHVDRNKDGIITSKDLANFGKARLSI